MATPAALITVQETQRLLFRRIIDAGINPELSMKIMAFWMWLELQGFQELIKKISSQDAKFLTLVCDEAEAVLASLRPNSTPPTAQNLMPIIFNLSQGFFSIEDKFVEKEAILKGIEELYNKSCRLLFQDILEERRINVDSKSITRWIRPSGEGPSDQGVGHGGVGLQGSPSDDRDEKLGLPSSGGDGEGAQPTAPLVPTKLNPFAKEWDPVTERAPEEDRCLFLTFSNGFPLTEHQIASFFIDKYGPCIERVYVHWPDSHADPPLFAKVVFKALYTPAMILSGQKQRKFIVDGRPLWCNKFDPEKSGHGWEN